MKEQIDLDDCVLLINQLKIEDPLKLYHSMHEISFDIKLSSILKVFTRIYDMGWLEVYYKAHEKEILEIFNCEGRR